MVSPDHVRRSMDLPREEAFFEPPKNRIGRALDREPDPDKACPLHGSEQFMVKGGRVQLNALKARPRLRPREGLAHCHCMVIGGVKNVVNELYVTKARRHKTEGGFGRAPGVQEAIGISFDLSIRAVDTLKSAPEFRL